MWGDFKKREKMHVVDFSAENKQTIKAEESNREWKARKIMMKVRSL